MNRILTLPDIGKYPSALHPYLNGAKVYDSSCSDAAKTLFIDGELQAYLKIATQGKLLREREMTSFLNQWGLAPKVLEYLCHEGRDYLMTEALDGEDGIAEKHLQNPQKLAACLGEYLRIIHALPSEDCPYPHRTAEMLIESATNVNRAYADRGIITEDIEVAAAKLAELRSFSRDEVVIHGDYCLPNIIMKNFELQGFVDLGTGGVGDKHYDLFWGLWTLEYNLGTTEYGDIFLEAYGKDRVDPQRLELCRLLAGFTE